MHRLEKLDAQVRDHITQRFASHVARGLAHFPHHPHDLAQYWALYHFRDKGQTAAEKWEAPPSQRPWLKAQQQAEIAIYFVLLDGGLRHLHTGQEHRLQRSAQAPPGTCLLGRVVTYRDQALLCGEHPVWLPPGMFVRLRMSDLDLIQTWDIAARYHDHGQPPLQAFLNSFRRLDEQSLKLGQDGFPPGLLAFAQSLRGKKRDITQGLRVEARLQCAPVLRILELPATLTLERMHRFLQLLMGWEDYHLHRFERGDDYWVHAPHEWEAEEEEGLQDERGVLLANLLLTPPLIYRYDFGDDWALELRLTDILPVSPEYPTCTGGTGSPPPEDCGKDWDYGAPFDLEATQARLARHYRKLPKKAANPGESLPVTSDALQALRQGRSSPPLESYRLDKLSLVRLMVAALLEAGRDLSLDELAERLTRAQVPLPHGVGSLRKAWKRQLPMRETWQGKVGLVKQGPEFRSALHDLAENLRAKYPELRPAPPPAPAPPDVKTPLTPEEVAAWNPPVARQRLIALLDAHGGRRGVADLGLTVEVIARSLAGKNLALGFNEDRTEMWLDQSRPEVTRVRELVRTRPPDPVRVTPKRTNRCYQLRSRWEASARGLVHVWFGGPEPLGVTPDRQLTGEALRDYLSSLEILIGLDPWTTLERLELPTAGRTVIDLACTRYPLDELMVLCGAQPLADDATLFRSPQPLDLLQRELPSLERLWRYGVIHGYVLDRQVSWNFGAEPSLYDAVKEVVKQGQGMRLTLRSGTDDFVPSEFMRGHLVGLWRGRKVAIPREEILDFTLPAGVEVEPSDFSLFDYLRP